MHRREVRHLCHLLLLQVLRARSGDGLKIEKDDGTAVTRFLYDGNNLLRELDDIGTVEAEFTYEPRPYAHLVIQKRDTDSSFYHFDGLRNTRALTDGTETVTDEYEHDAWGELRSSTGYTANAHTFKGELLAYRGDPDAGPEESIYSLHHRDYVAQQGRLRSEDPAQDDINRYRYCGNDPVNGVDPSGLGTTSTTTFMAALAVVGGASGDEAMTLPSPEKVEWLDGTPGNGVMEFKDVLANRQRGIVGKQVTWVNGRRGKGGFPHEYYYGGSPATATAELNEVTRNRTVDRKAANAKMRETNPNWKGTPEGYRWHHSGPPGSKTMELVHEDIHGGTHHSGTVSDRISVAPKANAEPELPKKAGRFGRASFKTYRAVG